MQRLSVFRSRFFWKLFLTQAALFLAVVSLVGSLIYFSFKKALKEEVQGSLQEKIALTEADSFAALTSQDSAAVRRKARELSERVRARITFINKDGVVIADSHFPDRVLENHANRPEFQAALKGEIADAQRISTTSGEATMYAAQAIYRGNELVGVARFGMRTQRIQEQLEAVRDKMVFISLLGSGLALILGLYLVSRVAIPIREMMRVCESMRLGHYDQKVTTLPADEVGLLGDTLNRLGQEITEQIARISLDRAQLKTILANMVEGIIALDDENRIQFCNRAAYELLGSTISDARGLRLEAVAGFDRLAGLVEEARATGKLAEEEMRIREEPFNLFLECYASSYKGAETSGIIVVIHDITEVRKLEGMRRDFVANVSHELKTPLTAIKGYTETLLAGALDDRDVARRFLEKVEDNTNRLVALVKDILNLAQIESQLEPMPLSPVKWQGIIDEILRRHEDHFKDKNLTIGVMNEEPDLAVLGDRDSMLTVLENLTTNAIRYTPAGGSITIAVKRSGDQGKLTVTDTGVGIKPKQLDRVFQRFYRVDKARSRDLGGTGLGLSIVKHMTNRMQGQVGVESELGKGSTFKVYLKVADGSPS